MLRFQAFIFGLLVLVLLLIGAEYTLRHHASSAQELLGENDPLLGWKPSATLYLQPPTSQAIRYYVAQGETTNLIYDESGFRTGQGGVPAAGPVRILCLGDERTLAPNVAYEQTFTSLWEQQVNSALEQNLPMIRIANAGLPEGCPLLWLLQDSFRFSESRNVQVYCFLGPEIFSADYRVRRTVHFDRYGLPVGAQHRLLRESAGEQNNLPAKSHPVQDYQLLKLLIPYADRLFLGEEISPLEKYEQEGMQVGLDARLDRQFLARMALEPLVQWKQSLAARGCTLTIVYLPHLPELDQPLLQSPPVDSLLQSPQAAAPRRSFRDLVAEYATQQQIPFCDLTGPLQTTEAPADCYESSGRFLSITGHQRVADCLRKYQTTGSPFSSTEMAPLTESLESPTRIQ